MNAASEPAIAILPYRHRLGPAAAAVPLDALNWPLGRPDRLAQGTLADLAPTDHLIVYPRTDTHLRLRRGTRARISLVMAEPSVIHARHIRMLRLTHRRFFRVLTFDAGLLAGLPNALLLPLGTTWVPEWQDLDTGKSRHMSLIASAKRSTEGHRLRHDTVAWARAEGLELDAMGGGYEPFGAKAEGLASYRFSVVIENVRQENYFSEKLVDAVLCDTVPIYWGCPNLDRFMDPSGIVQCATEADLRRAILEADVALHERLLPALRALQSSIARYIDYEARAARALHNSL